MAGDLVRVTSRNRTLVGPSSSFLRGTQSVSMEAGRVRWGTQGQQRPWDGPEGLEAEARLWLSLGAGGTVGLRLDPEREPGVAEGSGHAPVLAPPPVQPCTLLSPRGGP